MREKVRPLYSELQGYLHQAPDPEKNKVAYRGHGEGSNLSEQLNNTIDELNTVTSQDFSRFKVNPVRWGDSGTAIHLDEYRTKLSGLISRLHGEFFFDQTPPFGGTPSTVINQSQSQVQSMSVQILLELQSKIDEKLNNSELDPKKKTFLERIKQSLAATKDIVSLLKLIFKTGKDLGLGIDDISQLMT